MNDSFGNDFKIEKQPEQDLQKETISLQNNFISRKSLIDSSPSDLNDQSIENNIFDKVPGFGSSDSFTEVSDAQKYSTFKP